MLFILSHIEKIVARWWSSLQYFRFLCWEGLAERKAGPDRGPVGAWLRSDAMLWSCAAGFRSRPTESLQTCKNFRPSRMQGFLNKALPKSHRALLSIIIDCIEGLQSQLSFCLISRTERRRAEDTRREGSKELKEAG